jgi:hypothetical protein
MKRFLVILWLLMFCVFAQAATVSYPDASQANRGSRWGIAKFHFDANDVNAADINSVSLTTNYDIYGEINRITISSTGTEHRWGVRLKDSLGIPLFTKTDCNSSLIPYGYEITQPDISGSCNYRDVAVFGPLTCMISDVNHSAEVQTLTLDANATAGSFRLIYGNETTAAINYNATNTTIQSALTALDSVGTNNIVVTGTGTFNQRLHTVFTFKAILGNTPMIGITSSLTTTTSAIITETHKGGNDLNPIDVVVYYFRNWN